MNDTPVIIVVPIHAQPQFRDQIKNMLVDLAQKTRGEAGNDFYILHESTNQPNSFVIYERWKNQAALDFHMKQEYLVNFLENSRTMLAEELVGMLCQEISVA